MQPVVVVGAGISGIACARTLTAAGLPVRVLDRAGRAGGRMATIAEPSGRAVDVGASYFTVSDPRFDAVVRDWQRRGLARPWTDTFDVRGRSAERSTGPLRWAADAGLRGLVADLADTADLAVERVDVDLVAPGPAGLVVAGEPAAAVVLAMPDPQARAVLHPALARERAELYARFEPVLVLSAGWPSRDWPAFDGMFVNGDERLSWIADDGSRRGDGAPVLVAHSTTSWAAERPEHAEAELLRALRAVLGITERADLDRPAALGLCQARHRPGGRLPAVAEPDRSLRGRLGAASPGGGGLPVRGAARHRAGRPADRRQRLRPAAGGPA